MALTLVVPGLLAHDHATLAATPALRALAQVASAPRLVAAGIACATLEALGMEPDTALAPLAARGAGLDAGDDHWLFATPVTLVAGRDGVRVAARVLDLSASD